MTNNQLLWAIAISVVILAVCKVIAVIKRGF